MAGSTMCARMSVGHRHHPPIHHPPSFQVEGHVPTNRKQRVAPHQLLLLLLARLSLFLDGLCAGGGGRSGGVSRLCLKQLWGASPAQVAEDSSLSLRPPSSATLTPAAHLLSGLLCTLLLYPVQLRQQGRLLVLRVCVCVVGVRARGSLACALRLLGAARPNSRVEPPLLAHAKQETRRWARPPAPPPPPGTHLLLIL